MGRRIWKRKMISPWTAIALLGVIALPVFAADSIPVKAILITDCVGTCTTDAGGWDINTGLYSSLGTYSVLPGYPDTITNFAGDGTANDGVYCPFLPCTSGEQSNILNHNSVATIDTSGTLVNGLVSSGFTRTAKLHFYTTVANTPPACWGDPNRTDRNINGSYNQTQAFNWSLFSFNKPPYTAMAVGTSYPGFARMDFNVRNGVCDRQVFRFYLEWGKGSSGITITRLPDENGKRRWQVKSDQYGTASLLGQGGVGRNGKDTVKYGDWRMPFEIILIEQ